MSHHDAPHEPDATHGFAEGQASEDVAPSDKHGGDVAEGQEEEGHEASDLRRGDVAESQEELDHTHAGPLHGDYARGQEDKPRWSGVGMAPAPSAAVLARRWLEISAEQIERHAAELTALDAAIGDGDHGINLQRGFRATGERLAVDRGSAADLLQLAGETLVSTVGGAAGPLYGTLYLALAASLRDIDRLEPARFGASLESAVSAVARRGRSTIGEKTMLDALGPGAAAWRTVAAEGGSLLACARAAERAAGEGKEATLLMIATKGRASYLGERSRGHVDPGASSSALLLGALAEAVAQMGDGGGASR